MERIIYMKRKRSSKKSKTKTIRGIGWLTSDEDEIIRRQLRAENEKVYVIALDQPYYGSFFLFILITGMNTTMQNILLRSVLWMKK
jgi:hypothetical protein